MTQVANTYAQALYQLAAEDDLQDQILEQMDAVCAIMAQEPDFARLLASPNISKQERCEVLDKTFRGNVHQYLLNFLKILTEKGYIRHYSDCCKAYRDLYNADRGILPVCAVSAVEMTQAQKVALSEKLASITGKKISLTNRIDPKILGGVRLDYDGKRVDGTVQSRLDAIRDLLKNTVL